MIQVSIIVPIYNVAPYVEKCLKSVAEQTFLGAMECLLVDDCGQDESISIAERFVADYGKNDHRHPIEFRIIHHERNRGLSAARNTGIENSNGQWLYFLDSDDWIIPECIELMMGRVAQFPETEAVFAGAFNESRIWMDYEQKDLPDYSDDRNWIQEAVLRRTQLSMTAWNKLVRRSFIVEKRCFFKENMIHEDELWNFHLSQNLSRLSIVKLNTYHYEEHPQSIVAEKDEDTIWKRRITAWNTIADEIKGYRVDVQVKALCRFIMNLSTKMGEICFPYNRRVDLFFVFCRLANRSSFKLSLLVLAQGFLALIYSKHFHNDRIVKRIVLF